MTDNRVRESADLSLYRTRKSMPEIFATADQSLCTSGTELKDCASRNSIMHVGNFLSSKGYNRSFIEELADRLERAGWNILRTSTCESRPIRLTDMATSIWLRRRNFLVGHIAVFSGLGFAWAELASWMMRLARRPYVLSLHGGNLPVFARRWPNRIRWLLRSANVVVTPSSYLMSQMREYRADLKLLPNPVDVSKYNFRVRKQPPPRLVWLRAFHSLYNPTLGPRVVALLTRSIPDVNLTMIGPCQGDGSLQATREIANSLNVAGLIALPGKVSKAEVPGWLDKADIFINTTNVDNTPVSILEAMACGLCIVSTNVGGIPHLLEHEQDALLVPPDDPEAMASAVQRILTDNVLAERLSTNARKKAEQCDWSLILPQWQAIFKELSESGA